MIEKIRFCFIGVLFLLIISCNEEIRPVLSEHDLVFKELPTKWDTGIPLGNGNIGALIWKKDKQLRFTINRADLWDTRPLDFVSTPEFNIQWVMEQLQKDNYGEVQERFDKPYVEEAAPSKIPAGAIEFNIPSIEDVKNIRLYVENAVCEVQWNSGMKLTTFVHATKPVGWFRFTNVVGEFDPIIVPPIYNRESTEIITQGGGGATDLVRLGYELGDITSEDNYIEYNQEGWGGFSYQVAVKWEKSKVGDISGTWSITSSNSYDKLKTNAKINVETGINTGIEADMVTHKKWWGEFWGKSSISIPDTLLEKQWFLEQYKFGCIARSDAPPISLQAVWTADNGKLPPWKGDYHHDMNTQLSYWPAYSGNHLDLEEGFTNWMWKYHDRFKVYTKKFYGTSGLNVPGVCTMQGEPLGGWIQYACGPTVSAWLAHHLYLHWEYSMDTTFLKEKVYPWLREVAIHFDEYSVKEENGQRKLPLSSSPEFFDNSKEAWFTQTTNFDLGLIRWTYLKASEVAKIIGKNEEAEKWTKILGEWPEITLGDENEILIAPGTVPEAHRHLSHLVAWHPLGLIDYSNGEKDRKIIDGTLRELEALDGDVNWGFYNSWLANIYARAFNGEKAAKYLIDFAKCACSPNTFHLNLNQCENDGVGGPFTLEGNFAFASGLQEMLIQSHTGIVRVFPAIPDSWSDLSFKTLRTKGAFLISASKKSGKVNLVRIESEKGGTIKLENPFKNEKFICESSEITKEGNMLLIEMKPGEIIDIKTRR